jgi:tetratricopeptide (TPR) repeat protein
MKRNITRLVFLLAVLASSRAGAECIDWGRVMTKYEIDHMARWKEVVLLRSFDNFTKISGDDWLSTGIPSLLKEYLNAGDEINAIFGPIAKYYSGVVNPAYTIDGMYQHVEGKLRIFVKISERGLFIKQLQLDVAYPQNKQFFVTLGDAALDILSVIGPPYDKDKFRAVGSTTDSLPAYENYIRGVLAYWSFDVDKMDVARTWFDESKKVDFNYRNAYLGTIDVDVFLAMYNKQSRKAFAGFFEAVEKEISAMKRFSKRLPPPSRPKRYIIKTKDEPVELANRFLLGHASFVAGLNAAGEKKWFEAARYFEAAVFYVPEDAITWFHLSQMREKTGDKQKAHEAIVRATELNKCL